MIQSIFPTLPTVSPCIRATDFLRHLPATDTRSYQIPLDYYADEIIMGIRALALKRKVRLNKMLKRKEHGSEDDEYIDGSQGGTEDEEIDEVEEGQRMRKKIKTGVPVSALPVV